MIPNWFKNIFKTQRLSEKDEYTAKLAKYLETYGEPTGTRTGQWLEPVAQEMLGPRSVMYRHFKSKIDAITAARLLITQKRV